jgi:hypothetical protein
MPSFDRSTMLDEIKYGYYRAEMANRPPRELDSDDPAALKREQEDRAREEERFARESAQPAEERAHHRRAEKAAYLRDKLAQAEQAERDD